MAKTLLEAARRKAANASLYDRAKDLGVDALKAAVSLPESFVGLADIPTGGRVGKFIEDYTPIQFSETQKILDTFYSEERQQEQADVTKAFEDSFIGGLGEAVSNPAVPIGTIVQSLPVMLAGRAIASPLVARGVNSALAAGIGEGAITAGSQEEGIRSQTQDRLTTPEQSLLALGSGALTGGLGAISNKIGAKFGLEDIDAPTAKLLKEAGKDVKNPGALKKIFGGAAMEGVAEELPQSIQEQIATNLALGKPAMEGVSEAGGMGMISGVATGGGINTVSVVSEKINQRMEDIVRGKQSLSLTGSPTLEEQKSNTEASRAVQEAQQVDTAKAVVEETLDPNVKKLAEETKSDPVETHTAIQSLYEKAQGSFKSFADAIREIYGKGKDFALKLWNSFKSFAASKLAEERGSISFEDLKKDEDRLIKQIQKAKDNDQPAENLEQDLADVRTQMSVLKEQETGSTPVKFVNHSGGAKGADSYWDDAGKQYGVESKHYHVQGNKTPRGNVPISKENAKKADKLLIKANESLGRKFPTSNEYVNNLLRRNAWQVYNSDSVFAVGQLESDKTVKGGTGWAVQMAIDANKPVHVFDQSHGKWFTWDGESFVESEQPILTENFAGIGTREINQAGKDAIDSLYATQFGGEVTDQATEQNEEPPKNEKMSYAMSPEDNIYGENTSTLSLAEDGRRTASTRSFKMGNGIGSIITLEGRPQKYRVVRYEQITPEKAADPEWVKKWSQREGWTPEYFKKIYNKKNTVKDGSWQTIFEKVEDSQDEDTGVQMSIEEAMANLTQQAPQLPDSAFDTPTHRLINKRLEKKKTVKDAFGKPVYEDLTEEEKAQEEAAQLEKAKKNQNKGTARSSSMPPTNSEIMKPPKETLELRQKIDKVDLPEDEGFASRSKSRHKGVYIINNIDDPGHLAATSKKTGAVYVNTAKAEALFNDVKEDKPIDETILGENTKKALLSMGVNLKAFVNVFKTKQEFAGFLVRHEKAHSFFGDKESTHEIERRATLSALTPAQQFKLQKIWNESENGPAYSLGEGKKRTEKPDKQKMREAVDESNMVTQTIPDLTEAQKDRLIKARSEEQRKALYENEEQSDVTDNISFSKEDTEGINEDDIDFSKKSTTNRGAFDQESDTMTSEEIAKNEYEKEAKKFQKLAPLSDIRANLRKGQNISDDVKREAVDAKIDKQIEEDTKSALQSFKNMLRRNPALFAQRKAMKFDKFKQENTNEDAVVTYLMKRILDLGDRGYYVPSIIEMMKDLEGTKDLSKVKDAAYESLDQIESFINAEDKAEKELTPQEATQRVREVRSRLREKVGPPTKAEFLKKQKQAKILEEKKDRSQPLTDAQKKEKLKAFQKEKAKTISFVMNLADDFFRTIKVMATSGPANQARFVDFEKTLRQLSSLSKYAATNDEFKALSHVEKLKVVETLYRLSNSLGNKPFQSYRYNEENLGLGDKQTTYSVGAENVDLQRSVDPLGLTDADTYESAVDTILVDELNEAISSFKLVNTGGSYIRQVMFEDHTGGKHIKFGVSWGEIKELQAAMETGEITDLKLGHQQSAESGENVDVEFTNKKGQKVQQTWPLVAYVRTNEKYPGQVKLLKVNEPKEMVAAWESTSELEELIMQVIDSPTFRQKIGDKEASIFLAIKRFVENKDISGLEKFLTSEKGKRFPLGSLRDKASNIMQGMKEFNLTSFNREVVDYFANSIKGKFLQESLKKSVVLHPEQLSKLADQYKQYGITENSLMESYISSGANLTLMHNKLLRDIESFYSKTLDKAVAEGKAMDRKQAIAVASNRFPEAMKERFQKYADGEKLTLSFEEQAVFPAAMDYVGKLQQTVIAPKHPDKFGKAAIAKRIQQAAENTSSLATQKAKSGLPVNTEDIMTLSGAQTEYEKSLEENNQQHNVKVGRLRNRYAERFYQGIASVFGADLVVVSADPNFSSLYDPNNGKPQLVINVNNGAKFSELFSHELFHHVLNKASAKEREAFRRAVESLSGGRIVDEEGMAKAFSQVFTQKDFWASLSRSFEGRSLANRLMVRLVNMAQKLMNFLTGRRDAIYDTYENNVLIAQSDINAFYDALSSLIVDAYQGNVTNNVTKYFGGAATQEVIKHARDSKNWLNGLWAKIFQKGTKSYKDLMTNFEKIINRGLDFTVKLMPKDFLADWRSSIAAKDLANMFLNTGAVEMTNAYFKVLKKHEKMFDKMPETKRLDIIDFFARGLQISDRAALQKDLDAAKQAFLSGKLTSKDYTIAKEKIYKKHTVKVKEGAIDLNDPADIALAKQYGISDQVIEAFKEYKQISDDLYGQLHRHYPDLNYRPDHFGQSIKWFHPKQGEVDESIESVISKNRWEMERDLSLPTEGIASVKNLEYRESDPNKIIAQYINDAWKVLASKQLVDEAIRQGKARILTDDNEARRFGLHAVNDKVFDIRGDSENTHHAGWALKQIDSQGNEVVMKRFSTKASADEMADYYNRATSNLSYFVEEVQDTAKGGVVAKVYFDQDLAKMLNVVVAKDRIRNGKLLNISGNSWLSLKHLSTQLEFAFSLFHALTITQEMTASFASHSLKTEKGLKKLSGYNLFKSANDTNRATALFTSILENPENANSPEYKRVANELFGENSEDLVDLVKTFFMVGGRMDMDSSLLSHANKLGRIHYRDGENAYIDDNGKLKYKAAGYSWKAFKDSIRDVHDKVLANEPNSKIKALFRAAEATIFNAPSDWLMREFIPKVKLAAWAKEYTLKVKQMEKEITEGKTTKLKIADEVMKFVEDRFGEVNWAQQWINPTYKSLLQFTFRSFTWFTGSWKALAKAGIDVGKLGWFALKGEKYELTEKGLWGVNAIISHIALASILAGVYAAASGVSGDDEVPTDEEISLSTKLLFPRYDAADPEARLSIPSYVTEMYKIMHHIGLMGTEFEPSKLVSGRLNSLVGNGMEVWNGQDFRGVVIRDSKDSLPKQALDSILHIFSIAPISMSSSYGVYKQKGVEWNSLMFSLLGMTQAPAVTKRSEAANYAYQLRREQFQGMRTDKDQMDLKDETRRAAYQWGKGDKQPLMDLLKEGKVSPIKFRNALAKIPRINGRPNPRYVKPVVAAFKGLTIDGALEVWEYASDNEKKLLKPYLFKKYQNAIARRTISNEQRKDAMQKMRDLGIVR